MASTISEEVVAMFRADTTNLVDGANRAIKKVKEFKQEVSSTKGKILDPFSTIGNSLTGVSAKLGISGKAVGAVAAGGGLMVKAFNAANNLAGETADRLQGMNASLQQNAKINMFASSVDGLDSLRAKYETTRGLIREAQETQREADPYGFGGGVGGNLLTAASNAQMSLKGAVGLGPFSNFDREEIEKGNLALNQRIAEQQQRKLAKQYGIEQSNQVGLTQERLTGSGPGLRIAELERGRTRELNSIKGTDLNTRGNRESIEARFKEEIAAEKELITLSDQRYRRAAINLGIDRSLRTEETKRLGVAEGNLSTQREELQTHEHMTQEARRTLNLEILRGETEVRNARAENDLAQNRQSLAQRNSMVQASNLGTVAKQYRTELNTLDALKGQLAIVQDINSSKAQGLQLDIASSENQIRITRQNELLDKSPSQIQKHIRDMRNDKIKRDRFDQQQGLTDGLVGVRKDMGGRIIDGIDPITGERRAPSAGFQQPDTKLHSGHVGDRTSLNGSKGATDMDPDGGLSGGIVDRMFTESDASKLLRDAPSAEKSLLASRGDPARDPAARLAAKATWQGHSRGGHSAGVQHAQKMVDQQIISNGHLVKMVGQMQILTERLQPLQ